MKSSENIEDWYRNELENYNVTPDENVWGSLSDELDASTPLTDENVSEWYKKEVDKFTERPDYTVWEKLSSKLDTVSVWERLSVSLTKYEQYVLYRGLVIRWGAILILLFGSYLTFQNVIQPNPVVNNETNKNIPAIVVVEKSVNSIQPKQKVIKKDKDEVSVLSVNAKDSDNNFIEKGLRNTKKSSSINQIDDEELLTNNLLNVQGLAAPKLDWWKKSEIIREIEKNVNKNHLTEKDISIGLEKKEFLVKKEKDKIVFNNKRFSSHFAFGVYARRFYLGLNFGVKKQGVIYVMNKDRAFSNYSQKHLLDFGATFGSTLGWIISDKLNVETNLNLFSTSGYNRTVSNEQANFNEELNLNYTTVSVLAKKMNNKSTFDNKKYSTNLIGGVYMGYLNSSVSLINGEAKTNDNYQNIDFGLVVGVEQDRYITKSFVITPGIRYEQGLMNIINNSSVFNSSRNFSLNFNLGVKYIFLKKK